MDDSAKHKTLTWETTVSCLKPIVIIASLTKNLTVYYYCEHDDKSPVRQPPQGCCFRRHFYGS